MIPGRKLPKTHFRLTGLIFRFSGFNVPNIHHHAFMGKVQRNIINDNKNHNNLISGG